MPYRINPKTGQKEYQEPQYAQPPGMSTNDPGIFNQPDQPQQTVQLPVEPRKKISTEMDSSPVGALKQFGSNILKSGANLITGMASGLGNMVNPNLDQNTIANIVRLPVGVAEMAIPGEQAEEKVPKALANFYDERYGISNLLKGDLAGAGDKLGKTVYEDPVGYLMDASMLMGGTGTALKATKLGKLVEAGNILTKAGEITDPLNAIGKVTSGVADKLGAGEKIAEAGLKVENAGAKAGLSALKASPSAITKYKDLVGEALDTVQKENKLYGSTQEILQKVTGLIDEKQSTYNTLIKTGETVPVKGYTDMLLAKAKELKTGSISPETVATARQLEQRAQEIEKLAGKSGMVSVDAINNAKNTAFGTVSPANMADRAALNAAKIAGGVGIEYLDNYAKGSAKVGKELQKLQQFKSIVETGASKGQGGKLLNFQRGVVGGGLGSVVGAGMGNPVAGAIAGVAAENAINSPRGISTISQGTQAVGKVMQNAPELGAAASNILSKAAPIAKAVSRLTPQQQELEAAQALPADAPLSPETVALQQQSQDNTPQFSNGNPAIAQSQNVTDYSQSLYDPTQTSTVTGYTPTQLQNAMAQAIKDGKKNAYTQLQQLYTLEKSYQDQVAEKFGGGSQKPLSSTAAISLSKAETGLSTLNRIEDALKDGTSALWSKDFNPFDQKGRNLSSDIGSLVDIIGNFRTGATLTPEQQKIYMAQMPDKLDDAATVKNKLNKLRSELQLYKDRIKNSKDTTQNTGLTFSDGTVATQ